MTRETQKLYQDHAKEGSFARSYPLSPRTNDGYVGPRLYSFSGRLNLEAFTQLMQPTR